MEKKYLLVIFSALLSFELAVSQHDKKCVLNWNATDELLPFPDISKLVLEEVDYQVYVEFTNTENKTTAYAVEYYNPTAKGGRVDFKTRKGRHTMVYNFENKEVFELYESKFCITHNMTVAPYFKEILPTPADWVDKADGILGPSAMWKEAYTLWLNDKSQIKYEGEAEKPIRGLKTQIWKRCLENDRLTVRYYFAELQHNSIYADLNMTQVPVRIELSGTKEHTYEFFNFQPYITNGLKMIEIPKGAGCRRLLRNDKKKPLSYLHSNIWMRGEVIYDKFNAEGTTDYLTEKYTSYFNMAFDEKSEHLFLEYDSWINFNDTKAIDKVEPDFPHSEIYDYQHSVVYEINKEARNCTMRHMVESGPHFYLPDGNFILPDDPAFLIGIEDIYYMDQSTVRGYKVDVYESFLLNYKMNKDDKENIVVVSRSYLAEDVTYDGDSKGAGEPVQVKMTVFKKHGKTNIIESIITVNIFEFSTNLGRKWQIFNAEPCFQGYDKSEVLVIKFEADPEIIENSHMYVNQIEEEVEAVLLSKTEITPVRITSFEVDFGTEDFFVLTHILERPPYSIDFEPVRDKFTVSKHELTFPLMADSECARNCLETLEDCWGYVICGSNCYLTSDGTAATPHNGCSLHERRNKKMAIPSTGLVEKDITNLISQKAFTIAVTSTTTGSEPYFMQASSAQFYSVVGKFTTVSDKLRSVKMGYSLKTNNDDTKAMGTLSYEDCQNICLNKDSCEMMSFCLTSQNCILSSKTAISDKDIEPNTDCSILGMKYSSHYEKYSGFILTKSAKKEITAANVDDCARDCTIEKDFKCLSYDFCPSGQKQNCRLHDVHVLDASIEEDAITSRLECYHYSKRYTELFDKKQGKRRLTQGLIQFSGIPLEKCAKDCYEDLEFECQGFDYCQDGSLSKTICYMTKTNPSEEDFGSSSICNSYVKTISPDVVIVKKTKIDKKVYGYGLTGGIGFLLFVVGGGVGIISVIVITYLRSNRQIS